MKIFEIIFKIYLRNMLYKISSYMLYIIFYIRYLIYKMSVLHKNSKIVCHRLEPGLCYTNRCTIG